MNELYVIECRKPDGSLDFAAPQPESVFGMRAINGISEDAMAKIVYRRCPNAVLTGTNIPSWPANVDPRWHARRKTW